MVVLDDVELYKKCVVHGSNLLQLTDMEWDHIVYTKRGGLLWPLCATVRKVNGIVW